MATSENNVGVVFTATLNRVFDIGSLKELAATGSLQTSVLVFI